MKKLVGIKETKFKGSEGDIVSGKTFYYTEPQSGVEGVVADKFFLSDEKVTKIAASLIVGDEFEAYYNRFGKIAAIELGEIEID